MEAPLNTGPGESRDPPPFVPRIMNGAITCYSTYWAPQKNLVKDCRQTLDCNSVSCELSASMADALLFVNILV